MSRRDQIRMSEQEIKDFMADQQTIIINSIGHDGVPHPMPMWFGVEDDGSVVMTTFTKSQKIRNLERDPRCSLLVEDGTEYAKLRGVVIYGRAELIRDTGAVTDILVNVSSRSLNASEVNREALRAAVRKTAEKRTGIRIRPEKVISWDHRKLGGVY
jgi:PPOX class probable F420-dependent enzyme